MDPEASSSGSRTKSKTRVVIASACSACQKRKSRVRSRLNSSILTFAVVDPSKCDGKRPVCSQCQKKGTDCQFDTDDLRRITNLRSLNQKLSEKVADYEMLLTRLHSQNEEEAIDVLRQLRHSKDFAEGVEGLKSEALRASDSPNNEESELGSPSGFSRDSEPGSFRGSTWHPALQIRVGGPPQPASTEYFGEDASPTASVRSRCDILVYSLLTIFSRQGLSRVKASSRLQLPVSRLTPVGDPGPRQRPHCGPIL